MRKYLVRILMSLVVCLLFALPTFAADNMRLGVITGDNVNLRETASMDASIVSTLSKDTRVLIVDSKGDFFNVIVDGVSGFVVDDFVIVYDSTTGTVNADDVTMRSGPSTDTDKLDSLDDGDKVLVYGEVDGFYRVTFEDKMGFISSKYVSISSSGSKETSSKSDKSEKKESKTRSAGKGDYSEDDIMLIARVVHAEANGMGSSAYKAVASVIYNRIQSKKFPSSIEGVIYQSGQFSVVNPREKFLKIKPASGVVSAVESVFLDGEITLPEDVLYFKSARLSKSWGVREYYDTIGGNMFYT